jgi:rhodanese-related sulfurtransferase
MAQHPDLASAPRISVEDAWHRYQSGQAVFVDTRNPLAFKRSHIPGARLLPFIEFARRARELPRDAFLIFYCT